MPLELDPAKDPAQPTRPDTGRHVGSRERRALPLNGISWPLIADGGRVGPLLISRRLMTTAHNQPEEALPHLMTIARRVRSRHHHAWHGTPSLVPMPWPCAPCPKPEVGGGRARQTIASLRRRPRGPVPHLERHPPLHIPTDSPLDGHEARTLTLVERGPRSSRASRRHNLPPCGRAP